MKMICFLLLDETNFLPWFFFHTKVCMYHEFVTLTGFYSTGATIKIFIFAVNKNAIMHDCIKIFKILFSNLIEIIDM